MKDPKRLTEVANVLNAVAGAMRATGRSPMEDIEAIEARADLCRAKAARIRRDSRKTQGGSDGS